MVVFYCVIFLFVRLSSQSDSRMCSLMQQSTLKYEKIYIYIYLYFYTFTHSITHSITPPPITCCCFTDQPHHHSKLWQTTDAKDSTVAAHTPFTHTATIRTHTVLGMEQQQQSLLSPTPGNSVRRQSARPVKVR